MNNFYSNEDLKKYGFKYLGEGIRISRNCSIYGAENISIGSYVRIDDFCVLSGNIMIGDHVHIAVYTGLFGGNAGIKIEDYCGISAHCCVYAATDDYTGLGMTNPTIPDKFRRVVEKRVILKKHALVGAGSIILPGVTIGEGASFGSMSLINKDTEPWTVYVGAPLKELKSRERIPLVMEKQLQEEEKERSI